MVQSMSTNSSSSFGCMKTKFGNVAQIADVEQSVVGRPVVAGKSARSMHRRTGRFWIADVVDEHVVGPLHEGRVNRQEGLEALGGLAAGEKRRVFLGDADIEIALHRDLLLEMRQAGAAGHGRGDRGDVGSFLAKAVRVWAKTCE